MFNWLSVIILVIIETATHYLLHLTRFLVDSLMPEDAADTADARAAMMILIGIVSVYSTAARMEWPMELGSEGCKTRLRHRTHRGAGAGERGGDFFSVPIP